MNDTTTIKLRYYTKEQLDTIGEKNDSYDMILIHLLEDYKKHNHANIKTHPVNYYNLLTKVRKVYFILCQNCRAHKSVHVHHINKDRNNNTLDNLELLCKACHRKKHNLAAKGFNRT